MTNAGTIARRLASALPWHLRKTITAARAYWRGRNPPFEGVYSSFDQFAGTMIIAEDDQVRAAVQGLSESRRSHPRLGLLNHRLGRGALSQLTAMLGAGGRRIRVLDFGGAAGADFNNLLISNGADAEIDYHVVDFPAVCRAAEKLWQGETRISFSPDLPPAGESFDIVYSWGSIQYAPDPVALLTSFAMYKPSAILIVGTAFSDRGFVRKQINQTSPFPHWVMDLKKTEDAMAVAGYRLVCRQAVGADYNVDNYDEAHQTPDYASLLFLRT